MSRGYRATPKPSGGWAGVSERAVGPGVGNVYRPCDGPRCVLIKVRVTPNAKEAELVKNSDGEFEARVDEKAEGGKANKRLVEMVSEHLGIPKSRIVIVRGIRGRDKVLEVAE